MNRGHALGLALCLASAVFMVGVLVWAATFVASQLASLAMAL